MCDWVLPWCFLANSALASLLPRDDFKCAGKALFKEEVMVICVVEGRICAGGWSLLMEGRELSIKVGELQN
jgi:hypothetical protein